MSKPKRTRKQWIVILIIALIGYALDRLLFETIIISIAQSNLSDNYIVVCGALAKALFYLPMLIAFWITKPNRVLLSGGKKEDS